MNVFTCLALTLSPLVCVITGDAVEDQVEGQIVIRVAGKMDRFEGFTFSADGKSLFTAGGADGPDRRPRARLRVWDVATGREHEPLREDRSRLAQVAYTGVVVSPDGQWLAFGEIGTLLLQMPAGGNWDRVPDWRPLLFSPDSQMLATRAQGLRNGNQVIRLWDPKTCQLITDLECPVGSITSLAFSPDSKLLATGGADGAVMVSDIATRKGRELPSFLEFPEDKTVLPRWQQIYSVAFSPDGKALAVAAKACSWRPPRETGAATPQKPAQWEQVERRAVTLWDPKTLKELAVIDAKLPSHRLVQQLAYTPDGKILVMLTAYDLILWDVKANRELRTVQISFNGENNPHFCLSPDARKIAVGAAKSCRSITVLDLSKLVE
jgi:WD40 repeat protein